MSEGFPWWNFYVDLGNIRDWYTLWSALGWTRSCCEGTDEDVTSIGWSTLWGRCGGSLATSATIERVVFDVAIVDGSEREYVGKKVEIQWKWLGNGDPYFEWKRSKFLMKEIWTSNGGDLNYEISEN